MNRCNFDQQIIDFALGRARWDIDQEIEHAGSNHSGFTIIIMRGAGILPEFSQLPLNRVNIYRLRSHSVFFQWVTR
jgi:hypothetical protein